MNRVIYKTVSKKKNTIKLANTIAEAIGTTAESIDEIPKMDNTDTMFICTGIYAGFIDPAMKAFLGTITQEQVKQAVVCSTAASKKTPLAEIKKILNAKGITVLDTQFHRRASFLFINKNLPSTEDLAAAAEFAKNIIEN